MVSFASLRNMGTVLLEGAMDGLQKLAHEIAERFNLMSSTQIQVDISKVPEGYLVGAQGYIRPAEEMGEPEKYKCAIWGYYDVKIVTAQGRYSEGTHQYRVGQRSLHPPEGESLTPRESLIEIKNDLIQSGTAKNMILDSIVQSLQQEFRNVNITVDVKVDE